MSEKYRHVHWFRRVRGMWIDRDREIHVGDALEDSMSVYYCPGCGTILSGENIADLLWSTTPRVCVTQDQFVKGVVRYAREGVGTHEDSQASDDLPF